MRKKFIAGAVCPKCQALDRVVTYTQDHTSVLECVACGYITEQPKKNVDEKKPQTNNKGEIVVKLDLIKRFRQNNDSKV